MRAREPFNRRSFLTLAGAGAVSVASGSAFADDYPSRPIRIVVPYAVGGATDLITRVVAKDLTAGLGVSVIVENHAGGGGTIATRMVAFADPDGYVLLMAIDGTLVMNPFLYSKLPYDAERDFVPIALLANVPSVLVANLKVPADSLAEMIAIEKAKPGTFLIGNSTPTSQVAIELLNMMAGVKMGIVPFKGGTTQITAELAGDIPLGMESLNVSLPIYRDHKIKILALTSAQRLSFAPELPTIAETYPGYDLGIWQSIVTPAGTPGAARAM